MYYDYELERYVDENEIRRQYEYFCTKSWFHQTYEEFRHDNFVNADGSEIMEA